VFFNLGPFEIGVIIVVALIVFGPDRLPQLAKDAARMLRTLRDLTQNARTQLQDEVGPEFGNIDIRSFNPRTALQRAIFDDSDEEPAAGNGRNGYAGSRSADEEAPVRRQVRPLGRDEAAPYDQDAT
jgi:sec-independent protein translocase protein TatB